MMQSGQRLMIRHPSCVAKCGPVMLVGFVVWSALFLVPSLSQAACILPSTDRAFELGVAGPSFDGSGASPAMTVSNPSQLPNGPAPAPANQLPQLHRDLEPMGESGSNSTGSSSQSTGGSSGGTIYAACISSTLNVPQAGRSGRLLTAALLILPSPPLGDLLDPPKRAI